MCIRDRGYTAVLGIDNSSSDNAIEAYATLSTANNTESDKDFTGLIFTSDASAAGKGVVGNVHKTKFVTLAAKATRYLNVMVDTGGSNLVVYGAVGTTKIRARCAVL